MPDTRRTAGSPTALDHFCSCYNRVCTVDDVVGEYREVMVLFWRSIASDKSGSNEDTDDFVREQVHQSYIRCNAWGRE